MIWTALIFGFTGSLHCVGMCSPLAMAVTNLSKKQLLARLLYNTGRIFTYALQGSVIASLSLVFPVIQYGDLISLAVGMVFVAMGISGVSTVKIPFIAIWLSKVSNQLKKLFCSFLKRKSKAAAFLLGMLNGFLPCGLTFMAMTLCLTLPGPLYGFLFMLLFGLGTLPAMLGAAGMFSLISKKINFNPIRAVPAMLVLSGLMLLAHSILGHRHTALHVIRDKPQEITICR